MAGQLDAPPDRLRRTAAYFNHPEVAAPSAVVRRALGSRAATNAVQALKERLKDDIYRFIQKFDLEVLVPENILAIPMHVPLGLAMTEVIAERPCRSSRTITTSPGNANGSP
jgi:hypothetical protein